MKTLRATAKIDHMAHGGERVRVKVNMLLARGGKLRFEADSPLGGALATLTSDGQQFSLLDVRSNRFLTGPAKACNVARLIRLAIPPDDIVAVLMGGAPLERNAQGVSWDPNHGGREVLTLATPDGGQETIELDAHDKRWDVMRAERRDAAGRVLWRVTNDGFKDHDGVRLPDVDRRRGAAARRRRRDQVALGRAQHRARRRPVPPAAARRRDPRAGRLLGAMPLTFGRLTRGN